MARVPARRTAAMIVAAGLAAAACSSGARHATTSTRGKAGATRATGAATTPPAPAVEPVVHWSALHNPIVHDSTRALKDPALVFAGGEWHALASDVDAGGRWRIGLAASRDLRHWSPLTTMPHDPTIEGEASPDVVPEPGGGWVVTYQSVTHAIALRNPKLYYRTTSDFVHFSAQRPLGHELHAAPTDRMIDAAIAYTPAGLLLGYKFGTDAEHFELARSRSGSLDGPWTLVGRPAIRVFGDTIENYQFLHLRSGWQLLATSNVADAPFVFTLTGDPASPAGWLHWSSGRALHVPRERWNTGTGATGATYEHANCAYLVDRGPIGGTYYLVYSDSPNKSTFSGEGPAVLAIARSRDLVSWTVPPS